MTARREVARRSFLRATSASAGALAWATRSRAQAGGDIVVVGAGPFGGWTALVLREQGHSVTLLDAYGPGNSRAASGGETRQIRAGYEDREMYTRWVLEAFPRWKEREREFGRRLFYETGRLLLASSWTESLKQTKTVLDRQGVSNEALSPADLRRRFPQMNPEGVGAALFEPTTGVLKAREGCLAVAEAFEKKGGRFRIARAEPGRSAGSRLLDVKLSDGSALPGATFVFACGPWLPKVFPELLARKIFTPRRDVFFFGTPAGDDRFSFPNFPNYSEEPGPMEFYGFPSIDHRGFKVCPVGERTPFDPDADERLASAYYLKRARAYLALRFPALRDQPLLESRVCQLEMTVDEHFVIQKHPAFENVWIAGGGSGHAYKMGPVLGEYVAARILGKDRQPELEPAFRLKDRTFPE